MTDSSESRRGIELSVTERKGYYDPPWSLPFLVNLLMKRRIASWAEALPQGARILDVGCARGDLLDRIGRRRPDLVLVGVDLSRGMTRIARQRYPRLHVLQADGTRLPFPDESFDLVIVMHLLSNLDPEVVAPSLVGEACRVSRSWVCAEIKDPGILRLQLRIRRILLGIPGVRPLARFVFALPPASSPTFPVHVHRPAVLLAGLDEVDRLRPWPLLPTPTRAHLVRAREAAPVRQGRA